MKRIPNTVDRAVGVLGGPLQAVLKTRVSVHTWNKWRMEGRIANPRILLDVAEMTGIDPRELCGPPPMVVNQ